MMNVPHIDDLVEHVNSRYTLIAIAAKRARQITADNPELYRAGKINPVSKALHELQEDKIEWHHRNEE